MSQKSDIIKALKKGRKITAITALQEWGVFRLAARIDELRRSYDIVTTMKKSANGKRFAEYKLAR